MIFLLLSVVSAYSSLGHRTTAKVASHFLSANAKKMILASDRDKYLSSSELTKQTTLVLESWSTWADYVKHSPEYKHTNVFHFISPKIDGSFNEFDDCINSQNLVTSLSFYTLQAAMCSKSVAQAEKIDSIKFILHLVTDLSNPMHVCSRERGGTQINVNWLANTNEEFQKELIKSTITKPSFHDVWDKHILKHRIKQLNLKTSDAYSEYLIKKIHQDLKTANSWISPRPVLDQTKAGNSKVFLEYAHEMDQISFKTVWPYFDLNPNQYLSSEYYMDMAGPLIDELIMKAAYRFQAIMNSITECT